MSLHESDDRARRALCRFDLPGDAILDPVPAGLINASWRVTAGGRPYLLQRLHPVFDPRIHENISVVTAHLAAKGLDTPRLVDTTDGELWADLGQAGVWRLLTWTPGTTTDRIERREQAAEAGKLVARFHSALDDLEHEFVALRHGVHDTAHHLARLREISCERSDHRLYAALQPVAESILVAAERLPELPAARTRVAHGDLKINNVLFEDRGGGAGDCAVCLIDLDTLAPLPLAYELGDAWRSWCNPAGEDTRQTWFDLSTFEASVAGYRQGLSIDLEPSEREALLVGVEWVALELAARFATDVLHESYFGWDPERFPGRGEHNLVRAHGQLALHLAAVDCRAQRAEILAAL